MGLMISVSRGYQRTLVAPTRSCCPLSLIEPHPVSQCSMVRGERDSLTLSLALSHTDTFDLASVQFIDQAGSVCLQCCLINGSLAQGCHAEQRNFKNRIVRSFNASRNDGSLSTGRQCFESDPGEYTVVVYDINYDSTFGDEAYTSSLIIVSPPSSTRIPIATIAPTRGSMHW